MIRVLAGILLAGVLAQDPPPQVVPGEPTPKAWPVAGPANVEDESELNLRARRVERHWDPNSGRFTEALSDLKFLRTVVVVKSKWFEGALAASTTGRYGITLSTDEAQLYSERAVFGSVEPLFKKSVDDVKAIMDLVAKATDFLDELEKILDHKVDTSPKARENYQARVNEVERKLRELHEQSDLTGTIQLLRDSFFHIRNAQVWSGEGPGPKQAANDPPRTRKRIFLDESLTIEALRKTFARVGEILSSEIKVSTCLLLERLIAQAKKDEKRREVARSAARAASKLAEAAPVPDPAFGPVLERAASSTSDPEEVRTELRVAAQAHLVPQ